MRVIAALLTVTIAAIAALVPRSVRAEEPRPGSPFEVNLALDLPLTIGSGAASLVPFIFQNEVGAPACGLSCNPSNINALDRTVIGNNSPALGLTSDILFGAMIVAPVALDLIDVLVSKPPDGLSGFWTDMLVLAEVATADNLLNALAKYSIRRPRPLAYDPNVPVAVRTSANAGLSFYSGHASTSFALATAYSSLFMMRHPRSPLRIPVWLGTYALAATISVLRVESGNHFWTDVMVGSAVGSAVGLAITQLHRRHGPAERGGHGFALRVLPTALPGGGGLALTLLER